MAEVASSRKDHATWCRSATSIALSFADRTAGLNDRRDGRDGRDGRGANWPPIVIPTACLMRALDDTITGHEMLAPSRGRLLRQHASAFQAEALQAQCRGFETRLPLQIPFCAWRDTQPFGSACHKAVARLLQRSAGRCGGRPVNQRLAHGPDA